MRKIVSLALISLFGFAPALAFAAPITQQQQTLENLLIEVANLQAQIASQQSGDPLACYALSSQSSVQVNEPVLLAWGSIGALPQAQIPDQTTWNPNGAQLITIGQAGIWTYTFNFYGTNNASTTCTAKIVVTA